MDSKDQARLEAGDFGQALEEGSINWAGIHELGQVIVGLDNREEALDYAQRFGRGIDRETADRFVAMYVNELTTGYGERGRRAIEELLRRA